MKRKTKIIGIVVMVLMAISLVPFDTTFVPEWKLRILDESGNSCKGQFVAQYCTNYTLGIHPCEGVNNDSQVTDQDGYVTFPPRKIRASLLYRIIRPLAGVALLIANGEYGTNGSISTGGACGNKSIEYVPDGPLPSEIILPSKDAEKKN